MRRITLVSLLLTLLVVGCTSTPDTEDILVTLRVDGRELVYRFTDPVTVGQFLRSPEINIELGPLDRVVPSQVTQISDGMIITVARVTEEEVCENNVIPFRTIREFREGLQPGEQRLAQAGQNGEEQICYRVEYTDGVLSEQTQVRSTVITPQQPEIIHVGPSVDLEPVPVSGTLVYLSYNNAWMIRGSSSNKRQLTATGDLDDRIFSLSEDGRSLLIAVLSDEEDETEINQVYTIPDINQTSAQPVPLSIRDVLYAEWVPQRTATISYSTAEARPQPPGWQALNDLIIVRIDPQTGEALNVEIVLEESVGGAFGWWGTQYEWSPDGQNLAWIRAGDIGLVNFEENSLSDPLLEYTPLRTQSDWSWRSTASWSPAGDLLIATVHGPPVGAESPESSPLFNLAIAAADGTYSADIVTQTGIWSVPSFSPETQEPDAEFPESYLAYLKARDWESSIFGQYDLVVADRDGSNSRTIFPEQGQPGMVGQEFVWSADGTQIALIYQGNLWVVDVTSGVAFPLTVDGGVTRIAWAG